MRRGTTPTITATVDADLTGLDLYLAFRQAMAQPIVKTGDALEVEIADGQTTITTTLTQAETLAMSDAYPVEVQVRAIGDGGDVALATTIASVEVDRILQEGVLNE